jgi:hypothetical protein
LGVFVFVDLDYEKQKSLEFLQKLLEEYYCHRMEGLSYLFCQ